MQQVNTFDIRFDRGIVADHRTAHAIRLRRYLLDAWDRLRQLLINDVEVVSMDAEAMDEGPGILENYYDGAHDRVSAAGPITSFRSFDRR